MVSEALDAHSRFATWAARILRTTEARIEAWQRLILTAFVVTFIVYGARSAHLLEGFESWWLDRMAHADRPTFDAPITVVAISDADYYDPSLFGGSSPLHPGGLARIVERTVEHRARGVVLDVQIHPALHESAERIKARLHLYRVLTDAAASDTPIVLVRDFASEDLEHDPANPTWTTFEDLTSNPRIFWADPSIHRSGGYVRAVPRQYAADGANKLSRLTVLGAAIKAFGLTEHRSAPWFVHDREHDPTVPWRFRFSGQFLHEADGISQYVINAGALLSQPSVEGARSILTDRIALVGGTFYAGRDVQPTVIGGMAGIYVWAEAIGSWIRHDALREPREPISFALEFLIGVVAGFLLVRFGPAFGLIAALLIVSPLTIVFSLLAFGDRVLFVNFLPSFFGVYMHYQLEVHWEIYQLKKQIVEPATAPLKA